MNELELHFSNANARYGNAKSYKRNSSKEINASSFKYAKEEKLSTIINLDDTIQPFVSILRHADGG